MSHIALVYSVLLAYTSLQVRALLERDVDTVITQGLNLSPEPKHQLFGMAPEAAKDWIGGVKTRFELWSMDSRASRNGAYNFYQAQRLMRKSLYRDGELFVMLSYHKDPSLLSPLRFAVLDPSQIREAAHTSSGSGQSLLGWNREGITRDADGAAVSYKVWTAGEYGAPKMTEVPRAGQRGRLMMLHAMAGTDYAGQLRGISPLAVCVQDLENILDCTLAQVEKAKNQSNIAFTVKSNTDEPAADPFIKNAFEKLPLFNDAVGQYGSDPAPSSDAKNVTEESLRPVYSGMPHASVNRPMRRT